MTIISGFKGDLSSDTVKRGEMADDFGHTIHKLPTLCAIPTDAEDVSLLLKWAAVQSPPLRCAARGIGHSSHGQSQIYEGVAIDTAKLNRIEVAEDRQSITVGCGLSWHEVIDAAAKHQLRVPVTTANPFLTVGGSMSMAGMDYTSSTMGAAVDHLLALKVVTGTGDIIECSKTQNKALFDAVRCGLGEYGIMIEATFPLLPMPQSVRSYWLVYDDFDQAYEDMRTAHTNPLIEGYVLEVIPRQSAWYMGIDYEVQFRVRTEKSLFPFVPSISGEFMYLLTLIVYVEKDKDCKEENILHRLNPAKHRLVRGVWNNEKKQESYEDWKKFLDPALKLAERQCLLTQPNLVFSVFLKENNQAKVALNNCIEFIREHSLHSSITNFAISTYTRSAFTVPGFMAPSNCENFIMFNIIRTVPKAKPEASRFANTFEAYQQFDTLWNMVKQVAVSPDESLTGYAWGYLPTSWQEYYGKDWDRQAEWKKMFDPQNILGGCNIFGQ